MHQFKKPCIIFYMPGDKTKDKRAKRFADAIGYNQPEDYSILVMECEKCFTHQDAWERKLKMQLIAWKMGITPFEVNKIEYCHTGVILTAMALN